MAAQQESGKGSIVCGICPDPGLCVPRHISLYERNALYPGCYDSAACLRNSLHFHAPLARCEKVAQRRPAPRDD